MLKSGSSRGSAYDVLSVDRLFEFTLNGRHQPRKIRERVNSFSITRLCCLT